MKSKESICNVQSCIVSVSFPDTLDGVLNMIKENKVISSWSTDLDTLLNFNLQDELFWTAPRWMTEGDVIFFYQTKRAKVRSARILVEAQKNFPRKRKLINMLKRSKENADSYAGSIFACASVAGNTRLFEKRQKHFVSRLFAPLREVYIFEHPLPQETFSNFVKIGLSTITPLYKKEFKGIKRILSGRNDLPLFLENATLSDETFRSINLKNWRAISCQPDTKFIHEAQLRNYFADFLLNEIKDHGTPLLEECECYREKTKTGRADYFIKIFGLWIPVEAKLNISREKNLLVQAAKYLNICSFSPAKGSYRRRIFEADSAPFCLLIDRVGIYLISRNGEFIKSEFDKPLWKRETFVKKNALEIRKEMERIVSDFRP